MAYGSSRPPDYADIRLFTGEQRQGKSNSMVALAVDDYFSHLNGLESPDGLRMVAAPLNKDDRLELRRQGIFPNRLKYCRIFSEDGNKAKIIRIPPNFITLSPVHIFANFHVFGLKYAYITIIDIVKYMNTELFNDAWILSDESAMTDNRNSMTQTGKLIAQFGATIGKRNAKFCLAAQFNGMTEIRFRAFATTTVLCNFDKATKLITCEIKKKGEPSYSMDYYAPNYWRFFKTQELIAQPQHVIDRALSQFGDGSLAKQLSRAKRQINNLETELAFAENANETLRETLREPEEVKV